MASLTDLLDYHEWTLQKALEIRGGKRPTVEAVINADFEMRTRWMLSYVQEEYRTFNECVKYHRAQSAILFSDLHPPPGR
eukprot:15876702-Heterocapsa_arctica.AAC.1